MTEDNVNAWKIRHGTSVFFYKVEWLVHSGSNYFVLSVSFVVYFLCSGLVGTPWSSNVLAMCNILRKASSPAAQAFADWRWRTTHFLSPVNCWLCPCSTFKSTHSLNSSLTGVAIQNTVKSCVQRELSFVTNMFPSSARDSRKFWNSVNGKN